MSEAVLDAGPLIHLAELEALDVLVDYDVLRLPEAVWDVAARLAAEQRGYQAHGTIGLLIRSVRTGRRTPEEILKLLWGISEHSTLHIRSTLMAKIIRRLENEWGRGGIR